MQLATPKTYILKRHDPIYTSVFHGHPYSPPAQPNSDRPGSYRFIQEGTGKARQDRDLDDVHDRGRLLDSRVSTLVRIAEALHVDPGMLIPTSRKTSDETSQTSFRKAARSENPNPRPGTAAG
jgi:hypothetical protein